MKIFSKIALYSSIVLISLMTIACKKNEQKETSKFSIEPKTITVHWTGYKTTDKVAVKGQFKEIEIATIKESETAFDALNGAAFTIPISSLFTDEPERDSKLKTLFFGVMDNTISLTGTLNLEENGTGNIDLLMNGINNKIPITYIVSGQLVELEGLLNLDDWNGQDALASINEACFDLHKGPDGISKTWNEVAIAASIYLKKK